MPELWVDGRRVTVAEGRTVLEAAHGAGIEVPTLCWQADLPHRASCMVCVVEEERSGALLPSCAVPADEGQRILVSSPRAREARRDAVELLLAEHEGLCDAPCERVCPFGIDIPSVLRRIAAGRPALTDAPCETCQAPCERACRRGRQDRTVAIRSLVSARATAPDGRGAEASRCLQCDCVRKRSCALRRLEKELGANRRRFAASAASTAEPAVIAGEVSFQPAKCVKCGICVRVAERADARPGIALSGRGGELMLRGALGFDLSTALGSAAEECISRCPTGALARHR